MMRDESTRPRAIALTPLESYAIDLIMSSDLSDIVQLVRDCGYDPNSFFPFGTFRNFDFRGSDISDVSFEGSDLRGAQFTWEQMKSVLQTNPLYPPDMPPKPDVVILNFKSYVKRALPPKREVSSAAAASPNRQARTAPRGDNPEYLPSTSRTAFPPHGDFENTGGLTELFFGHNGDAYLRSSVKIGGALWLGSQELQEFQVIADDKDPSLYRISGLTNISLEMLLRSAKAGVD